ncbi:hypothetical protein ONA70_01265 [Micromonospora yasonensis]|uniref:hypothetical protein n=1 Tax=Micromonospora yasonensis TaxID=1128667 RepID=UPI00222EBC09|nr:hypothetical protein [Micromonospora yasonensis]MCW3838727.1 hypothetical protein [Micromonospora yasonensis]
MGLLIPQEDRYLARMRHIGTVIAAAVVGPLAWILFALGQDRSARAFADAQDSGVLASGDFVRPALVLAAGGILLGLIATLRLSPLGATLAGLAYVASYLGLLVSPTAVMGLLDHKLTVSGHQVDLAAPLRTGTALLVGSLLLVGVVSVRRWQRWPKPEADDPASLVPDEILSPAARPGRPLGVDGLGLTTPGGMPEPELVRAGPPGAAGDSTWAGYLSGDSGSRPGRSSDWPRQPSR